jgi:hypothetical protein
VKLATEIKSLVEIEHSGVLRKIVRFEALHALASTVRSLAFVVKVDELGVALVHLDEVGMLVHDLLGLLVLILVGLEKRVDRDLREPEQFYETVFFGLEVFIVHGRFKLTLRHSTCLRSRFIVRNDTSLRCFGFCTVDVLGVFATSLAHLVV